MPHSLAQTLSSVPRKMRRVKRALTRAGISQYAVARFAGTTEAYVWQVLNGRRKSRRIMEAVERLLAEARGGE